MAFETIRLLLAEKLRAVDAEMKVHEQARFTLEPYATSEFQDIFANNDNILAATISRNSFQDFQGNEDDKLLRRHNIYVTIYHSFQDTELFKSEDRFNEVLSDISDAFTTDRTLTGTVLACSLPEFTEVDDLGNLGNRKIPMHRCIMKMIIDEVVAV